MLYIGLQIRQQGPDVGRPETGAGTGSETGTRPHRTAHRDQDTGTEPGTGTGPGTGPCTDTGTEQGKSQNIYREQDRAQLADSQDQNSNQVTWNAKQEQARGLVKRNSFPHRALPLYISV